MRILHVYKDVYPPVHGGIERYIHDVTTYMARRGHESTVLVSSRTATLELVRRSSETCEIVEAPCLFRLLSNPVCPGLAGIMRSLHAEKHFDLVHFHHPLPAAAFAWRAARLDVPHIVTYHSDIIRQAALVPLIEPVLWSFLRSARAVIATSPAYAGYSRFLSRLGNVRIVPLGVDVSRFNPGPSPEPPGYFLFVGRFRRYKGIPVLLEAWRSLPGTRLVMVGGGPLEPVIRSASAKPGMELALPGDVTDDRLVDLYRGATALILPSTERSEAFGMVQIEAMACGTPVISTGIRTGVPWVNSDGVSGLVVLPGDPGAILDAVRAMGDRDLRDRFSKGAHLRVMELFRLEATMSALEEICVDAAES